MSDIQTSTQAENAFKKENSFEDCKEKIPFAIEQIGEHRNFSWQGRVDRFFEESKRKYFAMREHKNAKKYAAAALAFIICFGILGNQDQEFYASILNFIGDITQTFIKKIP